MDSKQSGRYAVGKNQMPAVIFIFLILLACQVVFRHVLVVGMVRDIQQTNVSIFRNQRSFTDNKSPSTHCVNLTIVGNRKFYILSAIAEQSPTDASWASIVFNGWEHRDNISTKYLCCFQFANGTVTSKTPINKPEIGRDNTPMPKQIVCGISSMSQPGHAGLVLANENCTTDTVFHKVVYRKRQEKPRFAIGAQIAHGSKSPKELIEWMEYHLHFGVETVIIYPYYDLNPEAVKVLNYYANRKQLEMVPIPRGPFSLSDTVRLLDVQVANFDAQQRLQEYKYFIIMDTDEYIVPGNNTNITNFVRLMEYLSEKFQDAAKFTMRTEMHLLEWEKTNNKTDILIAQHGYHAKPLKFAPKTLQVTERVWPGTIRVHASTSKIGYKRYVLDPRDVVLKHFRYFKRIRVQPLDGNSKLHASMTGLEKIRGRFMDEVAKLIARRVRKVKRYLKLN